MRRRMSPMLLISVSVNPSLAPRSVFSFSGSSTARAGYWRTSMIISLSRPSTASGISPAYSFGSASRYAARQRPYSELLAVPARELSYPAAPSAVSAADPLDSAAPLEASSRLPLAPLAMPDGAPSPLALSLQDCASSSAADGVLSSSALLPAALFGGSMTSASINGRFRSKNS